LRRPDLVSTLPYGSCHRRWPQLALACDLRVLIEDQFTMAEVALSLVPDLGTSAWSRVGTPGRWTSV
jgi:enoyl-CoA hydratase/carnithine racemase